MSVPAPMTLGQLLDDLLAVGREEILARYHGLTLVGPPRQAETDDWSFRTSSLRTVRTGEGDRISLLEEGFVVLPIKKTQRGAFMDTVLVGRAQTNDVVIPDEGISKLHARLKTSGESLMVFDAGSSNGTFVNDDRLVTDKGHPAHPGDIVTFGSRPFHLFDENGLLDVLLRLKDR